MPRNPGLIALLTVLLLPAAAYAAETKGCTLTPVAELPVTMAALRPMVLAKLDGMEVPMLLDSGAFYSMVSKATAERLMLPLVDVPNLRIRGVGGSAQAKGVKVDQFSIGAVHLSETAFVVDGSGASDFDGVLGQNILGAMDIEYDFANGVVRLLDPEGDCAQAPRAYWTRRYGVIDVDPTSLEKSHIVGPVEVNGAKLRAIFDTGAPVTMLSFDAATKAGISPDSPGAIRTGAPVGTGGSRLGEVWSAPVREFGIGAEQIAGTRISLSDLNLAGVGDLLVGADFFLSHRVYYAVSQHRLYFSYNGGHVFDLGDGQTPTQTQTPPPPAEQVKTAPAGPGPAPAVLARGEGRDIDNTPVDADGFARRAAAAMSRQDFSRAIEAYGRAIVLEPVEPGRFYDRSRARLAAGEVAEAISDLSEALHLRPGDVDGLILRARLYVSEGDKERSRADLAEALKAGGTDLRTRLRVAVAYGEQGDYAPSAALFDEILARTPAAEQTVQMLNGACWVRALWNRELDKAMRDCDAAVSLAPKSAAALDSRAFVALRQGAWDRAITDYDAALGLQPDMSWSLYSRGLAKRAKGLTTEGDADIARAEAIDPHAGDQARALGLTP